MKQYLELLSNILINGEDRGDRTGVGCRSLFSHEMRFNLNEGFPLVTTKQVFTRGIIEELLWFIAGGTNAKALSDKKVKIWDNWKVTKEHINEHLDNSGKNIPDEDKVAFKEYFTKSMEGSIGRMYGFVWRNAPAGEDYIASNVFNYENLASDKKKVVESLLNDPEFVAGTIASGTNPEDITKENVAYSYFHNRIDQMQELLIGLKAKPFSRRHIVSAWIPEYIPNESQSPQYNVMIGRGALAPCHVLQQYYVNKPLVEGGKYRLSMKMTQR